MDIGERRAWVLRLEAGAELIRMLQRCRALAVDASLPEPVHARLLAMVNLASIFHNTADRLAIAEALDSLGEDEGI
jgi:hypothetical protein